MNLKLKGLGYSAVVLVIGGMLAAWMINSPKSTIASDAAPAPVDRLAGAPSVAVLAAKTANYAPQLQLYAQLQSAQQVTIPATLNTDVEQVLVQEGERVSAGQRLIRLDTGTPQRQLDQLQSRRQDLLARQGLELQQYEANRAALPIEQNLLDIAQRSVDRLTNLLAQKLSSSAELENAERTLQNQTLAFQNRQQAIARYQLTSKQYQAQLAELDSQIAQASAQLQDASVSAPFAGVVSNIQVQPGSAVAAGSPLLELLDPEQPQLVAWVAARALASVPANAEVTGWLETEANMVPLALQQIDPAADAGSLRLFFSLQKSSAALTLNRYYRLWLNLPEQQAIAVPDSAVYSNRYVYQVIDDQLQRKEITLVGERFADGQLWRLIRAELDDAPILVTRLQGASQGLLVRTVSSVPLLAEQ